MGICGRKENKPTSNPYWYNPRKKWSILVGFLYRTTTTHNKRWYRETYAKGHQLPWVDFSPMDCRPTDSYPCNYTEGILAGFPFYEEIEAWENWLPAFTWGHAVFIVYSDSEEQQHQQRHRRQNISWRIYDTYIFVGVSYVHMNHILSNSSFVIVVVIMFIVFVPVSRTIRAFSSINKQLQAVVFFPTFDGMWKSVILSNWKSSFQDT